MAISLFASLPAQDSVVDLEYPERLPKEIEAAFGRLLVTRVWQDYFTAINTRIDAAPQSATTPILLTGQTASIATTPIPIASVAQGVYRVGWYARATTSATVSSSLIVTVSSTDEGTTCSQASAAMTSNSTALPASGQFIVYCDRNSLISYSTTYATVGATSMIYKLIFAVEAVVKV